MKKIIVKNKEQLQQLIKDFIKKEGNECDLNHIDTSLITNMSGMFANSKFNGDISKWDVSNVEDMYSMFYKSQFKGNISLWNVSNVTNMSFMFAGSNFNSDISHWNVSNVYNMYGMFANSKFNGDISEWNALNVEEIEGILEDNNSNNIPYWVKIEDFAERKRAVIDYQEILKNKQRLEELITYESHHKIIQKI